MGISRGIDLKIIGQIGVIENVQLPRLSIQNGAFDTPGGEICHKYRLEGIGNTHIAGHQRELFVAISKAGKGRLVRPGIGNNAADDKAQGQLQPLLLCRFLFSSSVLKSFEYQIR